ncbi:hypothetical protein CRENBAI_012728 [Crenichthys baileyi]|uniref:Uncharacterized protein n=1 Tax=Crenichthys baileyi TaxID=28760 RepID=A0AAV9RTY7_9TELE
MLAKNPAASRVKLEERDGVGISNRFPSHPPLRPSCRRQICASGQAGEREAPPRRSSSHQWMVLLTALLREEATPRFEDQTAPCDRNDPHFCSHGNQSQLLDRTFCRHAKLKAHSQPGQLAMWASRRS